MNKLYKIMSLIVVMIMIISMSVSTYAYTNQDVISYISQAHTVNGRTLKLGQKEIDKLTQYLTENPVTSAQAGNIISKLDSAKIIIQNSGKTNLKELDQKSKAQVMALVKEAGSIAKLVVIFDTKNEIVEVKDINGNVIIGATSYAQLNTTPASAKPNTPATQNPTNNPSPAPTKKPSKLVYTGNDYSVVIKSLVAVVAIATIGVVVKKNYAK